MTPLSLLVRFSGVAILVILALFFSGCYGSKETDDVAYVLLLGVDKAEGGKQRVTYQVAVPGAVSGGSQKEPWIINTVIAPSPAESRMLLKTSLSRFPIVSHFTAYIFSEEVARQGLGPSLSYIARNREYRETVFLIIVRGSAEEYIKRNKPALETLISKYYENTLLSANEGSYTLLASFHDFYTRFKNGGGSPYAVYSSINPMTGQDKPAGIKTPEQKGSPYLPGGIPRSGTANPVDFAGMAVFRGDKMVGVLNSDETRAVAILQGKFTNGFVGVVDPLEPKKDAINVSVSCDQKPKISAVFNDEAPKFNVEVKLEIEILGITAGINYEAPGYQELMETQVANLFKEQITMMIKHTQKLGTDPIGFGLYLRPKFQNTSEMEQTDMTAIYQAADIRVNVTAKMRRTGLIWRTSPLKNK